MFYRDTLGLKIVAAFGREDIKARDRHDGGLSGKLLTRPFQRRYVFELPRGEFLILYDVPHAVDGRQSPPLAPIWPEPVPLPRMPSDLEARWPVKVDHVAFNVGTLEDVCWFRDRLKAFGVPVSEVIGPSAHTLEFISIYFYDPNGVALEISTHNLSDPKWKTLDKESWLRDADPPAALLEG